MECLGNTRETSDGRSHGRHCERTELTNEDGGEDGHCSAALGKYWKDSYPELRTDETYGHGPG
jgi:hypothetical protein